MEPCKIGYAELYTRMLRVLQQEAPDTQLFYEAPPWFVDCEPFTINAYVTAERFDQTRRMSDAPHAVYPPVGVPLTGPAEALADAMLSDGSMRDRCAARCLGDHAAATEHLTLKLVRGLPRLRDHPHQQVDRARVPEAFRVVHRKLRLTHPPRPDNTRTVGETSGPPAARLLPVVPIAGRDAMRCWNAPALGGTTPRPVRQVDDARGRGVMVHTSLDGVRLHHDYRRLPCRPLRAGTASIASPFATSTLKVVKPSGTTV